MCNAAFKGERERTLMKNIAYAGALAALLGIDIDVIRALLQEKFAKKPALLDSNYKAIALGYDYAQEHYACPLPFRLEQMDATQGRHPHRRQHRRRARLRLRRRDGRRVVSDHAVDVADGDFRGFCQQFRTRPDDQEEPLRHRPGGGRAGRRRHGDRRRRGRARARSRPRRARASR